MHYKPSLCMLVAHAGARLQPNTSLARRLCTRPTLGLDDGDDELWDVDISNSTGVGQQRRKLLSKNSVTAAFSAQSLWSAGYLGTGVKMGVFDTGIRQDHPHVKNIKCAHPCLVSMPPCAASR